MFIDRLKHLCLHYGVTPKRGLFSDAHSTIDLLDDVAGIRTRYPPGHDGCCSMSYYPFDKCRRYVGARVALHEAHLYRCDHGGQKCLDEGCDQDCHCSTKMMKVSKSDNLYHWLGKEADTIA